MAVYEAEVSTSQVVRVVVSPVEGWAATHLGGTWVLTSDPYGTDVAVEYTGIGHHYDPGIPERFVGQVWDMTAATIPASAEYGGGYAYVTQGELVWHLPTMRAWRNLLPDDSPNVWEPGVANWREYPMGVEFPMWVQPVGAFDAYPVAFVVEHNGDTWISSTPDNVWEPGVFGWDEVI